MNISQILEDHKEWLMDNSKGKRANLSGANLSGANLSGANLSGANLRGVDLRRANLRGANLSEANLSGANLRGANLSEANLSWVDLSGVDLRGVDLRGASWKIGEKELVINKTICLIQEKYTIYMFDTVLKIGCKEYEPNQWWKFSDEEISKMGSGALEWWKTWKPILKKIYTNGMKS